MKFLLYFHWSKITPAVISAVRDSGLELTNTFIVFICVYK